MFQNLKDAKYISLDIETYDPDLIEKGCGALRNGKILGIAVGSSTGVREYYSINHPDSDNLELSKVINYLNDQLDNPKQYILGANILYDLEYLTLAGLKAKGKFLDVQIAEPLIDENQATYSLESLANKYLNESKKNDWLKEKCQKLDLKGDPRAHIWRFPAKFIAPYAKGDVDLPLRIFEKQKEILKKESLLDVFSIECKLIPLLLKMKLGGCRIDVQGLYKFKKDLTREREILGNELAELGINPTTSHAGRESIAQYFKDKGITLPVTPKTGKPKVDKHFLKKSNNLIAQKINEFRQVEHLLTTFIDSQLLGTHINGRIHAQFNALKDSEGGTVTGRFSSSKPNLQNIPARDSRFAGIVRSFFLPEEGHLFGSVDYSQIEYRILCHLALGSGSEEIREALRENPKMDIHEWTAYASGLCHDSLSEAEKKKARSHAKNINFGLIYGQGAPRTASSLGIPIDEAIAFIKIFNKKLPFAKQTAEEARKRADRRGWVKTILGRRRRFNLWESSEYGAPRKALPYDEAKAEFKFIKRAYTYKALNAIVQGSSADLLKLAMVKSYEAGLFDILVPLTTVHDELNVSVPQTPQGTEAYKELVHIMENCYPFRVPIIAEAGLGKNWSEAK